MMNVVHLQTEEVERFQVGRSLLIDWLNYFASENLTKQDHINISSFNAEIVGNL